MTLQSECYDKSPVRRHSSVCLQLSILRTTYTYCVLAQPSMSRIVQLHKRMNSKITVIRVEHSEARSLAVITELYFNIKLGTQRRKELIIIKQ
jgi:hypothetical protein